MLANNESLKLVRSSDGIIAGVFEGLGHRLDISPNILRLGWLATMFFFGTGLLLYIVLAIALPREDKIYLAHENKILGVCSKLSSKYNIEIGLVRLISILALLSSFGLILLAYLVLYFTLEDELKQIR